MTTTTPDTALRVRAARRPIGWVAGHPVAVHSGVVALALAIWAAGLPGTDVRGMSDFGLLSVLPATFYVALGMLTVSFCVAVCSPRRHWLLLAVHLLAAIVILHGTPAILYGTLRYAWAWKHVGIVDYIQRHGSVNPHLAQFTAYQSWPGFFALAALIVQAGGFRNALAFASWAPLFYNVLFAAAVMFVLRAATHDRRLVWMAAWVFCLTNWVGQDYFSPQATAYFLYLVLIGMCVRWLRPRDLPSAAGLQRIFNSERTVRRVRELVARGPAVTVTEALPSRPAVAAIACLTAAAIVSSHQLTPFMLMLSLGALAAARLCELRGLPLVVAVMTGGWVMYMSVTFLQGNLYWIVQSIGSLNLGGSTLSNLAVASPDHALVAQCSRLLTGLVGLLALAGGVRRWRRGHVDSIAILLAAAPALMVWGNAYGGEVLFRIYFFALPFLAFLVAGLLFPTSRTGRGTTTLAAAIAISAALLTGMLISYYGNERMNYFTRDEVRAAEYLLAHAPAGSTLLGVTGDYPLTFRNYEYYTYLQITTLPRGERLAVIRHPAGEIARLIAEGGHGSGYMIFSRGQQAEVEINGLLPRGSLGRIESALRRSPRFRVIYDGRDSQVFELADRGGRA